MHSPYEYVRMINLVCLFLDVGADTNFEEFHRFVDAIACNSAEFIFDRTPSQLKVLSCLKRILILREDHVDVNIKYHYERLLRNSNIEFEEKEYAENCEEELAKISKLGLRGVLDGSAKVGRDFKMKFGAFEDFPGRSSYPIYGRLLKIMIKRKLVEFERKKPRITKAMPLLTSMVWKFSNLPSICAEEILWNLKVDDLQNFLDAFTKKTV